MDDFLKDACDVIRTQEFHTIPVEISKYGRIEIANVPSGQRVTYHFGHVSHTEFDNPVEFSRVNIDPFLSIFSAINRGNMGDASKNVALSMMSKSYPTQKTYDKYSSYMADVEYPFFYKMRALDNAWHQSVKFLNPSRGTLSRVKTVFGNTPITIVATVKKGTKADADYSAMLQNLKGPDDILLYETWKDVHSVKALWYCGFTATKAIKHNVCRFLGWELNPKYAVSAMQDIDVIEETDEKIVCLSPRKDYLFSEGYRFCVDYYRLCPDQLTDHLGSVKGYISHSRAVIFNFVANKPMIFEKKPMIDPVDLACFYPVAVAESTPWKVSAQSPQGVRKEVAKFVDPTSFFVMGDDLKDVDEANAPLIDMPRVSLVSKYDNKSITSPVSIIVQVNSSYPVAVPDSSILHKEMDDWGVTWEFKDGETKHFHQDYGGICTCSLHAETPYGHDVIHPTLKSHSMALGQMMSYLLKKIASKYTFVKGKVCKRKKVGKVTEPPSISAPEFINGKKFIFFPSFKAWTNRPKDKRNFEVRAISAVEYSRGDIRMSGRKYMALGMFTAVSIAQLKHVYKKYKLTLDSVPSLELLHGTKQAYSEYEV